MKFETAVDFIRELEELNGSGFDEIGQASFTASYHLMNEATAADENRWSVTVTLYDVMGDEEPGQPSCPVHPPTKVMNKATVEEALDAWTSDLEELGII